MHPEPDPSAGTSTTCSRRCSETIDLARLRTVSLKELDGFAGLLPALFLPNNYTRDVPSVSFKGLVDAADGGGPADRAASRRCSGRPERGCRDRSDLGPARSTELDVELVKLPSVVTWSRLEPLALTPDLTPGLQALLGDPLWLLGRQWQFGELRGEDGGTPISAVVEVEQAPLSRLRRRRRDRSTPVDVVDERRAARAAGSRPSR